MAEGRLFIWSVRIIQLYSGGGAAVEPGYLGICSFDE